MRYVASVWTRPGPKLRPIGVRPNAYGVDEVAFWLRNVGRMAPDWTPLLWTDQPESEVDRAAAQAGFAAPIEVRDVRWFIDKYRYSGWWPGVFVSHPDYHECDAVLMGLDQVLLKPLNRLLAQVSSGRIALGFNWCFKGKPRSATYHNAFAYFPAYAPHRTLWEYFEENYTYAHIDKFDEIFWQRWYSKLPDDAIAAYPMGSISSWKCLSGYQGAWCDEHPATGPRDTMALCFHGRPKPWHVVAEKLKFYREIMEVTQ